MLSSDQLTFAALTGDNDAGAVQSAALLDQSCREMRFLAELVLEVKDGLPVQRKPLSDWSKALHLRATSERRNGLCPCCQTTPVCPDGSRIAGSEYDHWFARHRNRVEETWLVCAPCNQQLESSTDFKTRSRSAFEAYQQALRPYVDGCQARLF